MKQTSKTTLKAAVLAAILVLSVLVAAATQEKFVLVEGGSYTMGDTFGGGYDDEKPIHSVTVSSFYMSKNELTQEEFQAVMGFNPSRFEGDNLPVETVTWYDAVAYCNALSQKEGLKQAYTLTEISKNSGGNIDSATVNVDWSANGYRLPTEAEWEYAAKGGKLSKGYKYAGGNNEGNVAWYYKNSGSKTQPVGMKQANELGIYDLSGNVAEWCWDWYERYSAGVQADPRGPAEEANRVERGGGWDDDADNSMRASSRGSFAPYDVSPYLGFRPVRTK